MSDDRRAEIALELEWLDARDRFVAAKANRAKDPDEYRAAKAAVSQMRTYWRAIGEAVGTRSPVGGAVVTATVPDESEED